MSGEHDDERRELLAAASRTFELTCLSLYYVLRTAREAGVDLPPAVLAALDATDAANEAWLRLRNRP